MLVLTPRQSQILATARQSGTVLVDELALRFEVTPQTIRKDLNEICNNRLLARTHGGAMLSSGVANMAYDSRRQIAAIEKQLIGQHAAKLIPNNCSLFINIGTTTEEVARALIHHEGLLVITNNIHVATILMPCPTVEVMIVGGVVRRTDGGIIGEQAIDMISQFKVDHAVIGVSAIDDDGALLDFDYREVRAAQTTLQNSRNVILVSDSMKFSRSAPVRIGHLSQVDVFVTDIQPPNQIVELCKNKDVRIDVVGMRSESNGDTSAS